MRSWERTPLFAGGDKENGILCAGDTQTPVSVPCVCHFSLRQCHPILLCLMKLSIFIRPYRSRSLKHHRSFPLGKKIARFDENHDAQSFDVRMVSLGWQRFKYLHWYLTYIPQYLSLLNFLVEVPHNIIYIGIEILKLAIFNRVSTKVKLHFPSRNLSYFFNQCVLPPYYIYMTFI